MLESFISRYLYDEGVENKKGKCSYLTRRGFFVCLFVCNTLNNQHLQCIHEIDGAERKKIRTELNNVK